MAPTPADVPTADGMPRLGLGTWQNDDHEQCVDSVATALEMGYRHIDTAQIYGNEAAVGEGIEQSAVSRDEIFLATKVWIDSLAPEDVHETTQASLDRLGTDYLDLLYVHWPAREYDPAATLSAFESLYETGTIERIGMSNFEPAHLDRAQELLDAPLFANQVELHPYLPQAALQEYATDHDIQLVAYSPLARGRVVDDEALAAIAQTHDATPPQVALAWLREHGITAIPKATSEAHIRDNWESLSVTLTDEECARIDNIDRTERFVHPGFAPEGWS